MFGINLQNLKKFRVSLGPVEQAQIIVSFVVVASLITIVVLRWTSGHTLEWLLFGSVVTVGAFGFIIVTITLKYGRLFEEQKQELLALNAFTESMNRSVTIQFLLQNALYEVQRLLDIEYGWIFRTDGNTLSLSAQRGTEELDRSVLDSSIDLSDQRFAWVFNPKTKKCIKKKFPGTVAIWNDRIMGVDAYSHERSIFRGYGCGKQKTKCFQPQTSRAYDRVCQSARHCYGKRRFVRPPCQIRRTLRRPL